MICLHLILPHSTQQRFYQQGKIVPCFRRMVEQNYRSSISADAEEGREVVRAQAVHLQAAEVEEQARLSLQGLAGERSTVSLLFNLDHFNFLFL